jgi:hypothetical protein
MIATIIERKFDLRKLGSSFRSIRRKQGIYACDRSNKAYKSLEGNKGQLNVILRGVSRNALIKKLDKVCTLQQVKGSKDKIIPINLEDINVVDTFFIEHFILKCCPKNSQVQEFFEEMNKDELIEFFVNETKKLGRTLPKSL